MVRPVPVSRRQFLKAAGLALGAAVAIPKQFAEWSFEGGQWFNAYGENLGTSIRVSEWIPFSSPLAPNGGDVTIMPDHPSHSDVTFHAVTGAPLTHYGVNSWGQPIALGAF